jgi:anti-sigma-K factor RskA
MRDIDVERLLRAAATVKNETTAEMPFGFDTRVIALSRQNGNGAAFARFLRRVAVAAVAVLVIASAGAYFEANRDGDLFAGPGNEYAIADSAIQDEVAQ